MKILMISLLLNMSAWATEEGGPRERLDAWLECNTKSKLQVFMCFNDLRQWAFASPANYRDLLRVARDEYDQGHNPAIFDLALGMRNAWVQLPPIRRNCTPNAQSCEEEDSFPPVETNFDFMPPTHIGIVLRITTTTREIDTLGFVAGVSAWAGSYYLLKNTLGKVSSLARRAKFIRLAPVFIGSMIVSITVDYVVNDMVDSFYEGKLKDRIEENLATLRENQGSMGKVEELSILRDIVADGFLLANIYDDKNRDSILESGESQKVVEAGEESAPGVVYWILDNVKKLSIPEAEAYLKMLKQFLSNREMAIKDIRLKHSQGEDL